MEMCATHTGIGFPMIVVHPIELHHKGSPWEAWRGLAVLCHFNGKDHIVLMMHKSRERVDEYCASLAPISGLVATETGPPIWGFA